MNALKPFEIPVLGIQIGLHDYHYDIDKSFLDCFETEYKNGQFQIKLVLDKKASLFDIHFDIQGKLEVPCDTCLENIFIPIQTKRSLVFKYSDDPREEEEIVFLDANATSVNISKYIYEFIMLAIPLRKAKDCASEGYKDCNKKILAYLDRAEIEEEEESELAKALKNININQKK